MALVPGLPVYQLRFVDADVDTLPSYAATTQLLSAGHPWQTIFGWYVVPGWIWASVFLFSTSSKNAVVQQSTLGHGAVLALPGIPWRDFLSSGPMWLLCAQQFFRAAAMMFFQSWFPTFLRETRHVDLAGSGKLAFVVGVGALLGGMSGGIYGRPQQAARLL